MKLSKIPKHIWWGVLLPLVLVGLGGWRLWPEIEEYRLEYETSAIIHLRHLALLEIAFLHANYDGNGVKDFWTADVAGLVQSYPFLKNPYVQDFQEADVAPLKPGVAEPVPFGGYLFLALERDTSIVPPEQYRQDTDQSGRKVHHLSKFAFCAYPAMYDWRHRRTFIVNQGQVIYAVNNDGNPITEWPTDKELAEKFTKLD